MVYNLNYFFNKQLTTSILKATLHTQGLKLNYEDLALAFFKLASDAGIFN